VAPPGAVTGVNVVTKYPYRSYLRMLAVEEDVPFSLGGIFSLQFELPANVAKIQSEYFISRARGEGVLADEVRYNAPVER
jgi:hypothetical protein